MPASPKLRRRRVARGANFCSYSRAPRVACPQCIAPAYARSETWRRVQRVSCLSANHDRVQPLHRRTPLGIRDLPREFLNYPFVTSFDLLNHLTTPYGSVGLGCGVGRGRGVALGVGVAEGVGVALGVAEGFGVAVGVQVAEASR